jgi:hypothetical protein
LRAYFCVALYSRPLLHFLVCFEVINCRMSCLQLHKCLPAWNHNLGKKGIKNWSCPRDRLSFYKCSYACKTSTLKAKGIWCVALCCHLTLCFSICKGFLESDRWWPFCFYYRFLIEYCEIHLFWWAWNFVGS